MVKKSTRIYAIEAHKALIAARPNQVEVQPGKKGRKEKLFGVCSPKEGCHLLIAFLPFNRVFKASRSGFYDDLQLDLRLTQ